MEECGFLSQKKVIKEEPLIMEPVGHRENIQNKQLKFFILNPVIYSVFFLIALQPEFQNSTLESQLA